MRAFSRISLSALVCASLLACSTAPKNSEPNDATEFSVTNMALVGALACGALVGGSHRAKAAASCAVIASAACFIGKTFFSQQVKTAREVQTETPGTPGDTAATFVPSTISANVEVVTGAVFAESHNVRIPENSGTAVQQHREMVELLTPDGASTGVRQSGKINSSGVGGEYKINFSFPVDKNFETGKYLLRRTVYAGNTTVSIGLSNIHVVDRPIKPAGRKEFPVFFATNRKLATDSASISGIDFLSSRAAELSYGVALVNIPGERKFGSFEPALWQKLSFSSDGSITVSKLVALSEANAFGAMRSVHNQVQDEDREVLLYIHGFNTTFRDGLLRAAQLGYDLKIRGLTAYFSWPSAGEIEGYSADEAAIEASEQFLADYVSKLIKDSGAKVVHVIAHSMGTGVSSGRCRDCTLVL